MKRFAKLLLVTVGFGALGFVMSLVPQRSATGAGAAPVTIAGPLPVPVTGGVSATVNGTVGAQQTGNWSVGIAGTPTVNVASVNGSVPVVNVTGVLGSLPLVTLDALASPTAPFQKALCLVAGVSPLPFGCSGVPFAFQVPDGVQGNPQRLVIEYVSGNCTALPSLEGGLSVSLLTVAGGQQVGHAFAVVSNGSNTLTFGQRTKIYADPDSQVLLEGNLQGGLSFGCMAAISGYLISPTL